MMQSRRENTLKDFHSCSFFKRHFCQQFGPSSFSLISVHEYVPVPFYIMPLKGTVGIILCVLFYSLLCSSESLSL